MERNQDVACGPDVVSAALRTHAVDLRAFVRGRVPADDVDDILQIAAMRAIERADSLTDPERVRAWLYRIHRNVIVDTLRSRARQRRLRDQAGQEANLQAEAAMSIPRESCKCSVSLAKQINPAYASVLELVDAGDATVAEAARVLGISANNAAVRLHRARTALKAAMLQHCGVTNPAECDDCRCVYDGCCPE